MEFFEHMEPLLKTMWFIALPASLIFLVQTVMTFFGADAGEGTHADFDSNLDGGDAPFQLFSFRNLINFLLGLSWSGISFYNYISNPFLLISLSFVVGIVFVLLFFLVIKQLMKLSEDNSFRISDALNKSGETYLAIPASRSGKGKILLSVKGSFHELEAITENEKIETGTIVKVVKIENGNLIVEKIN